MAKVSFLIFTVDPFEETLAAAKKVYDISDEIVIVDSGHARNRNALLKAVKIKKLKKIRIFSFIALGYAEPAYHYGISLCKNEWVFILDTDEEPSHELLSKLDDITNDKKIDVIKIKRFENKEKSFYTWQTRLFRKGKVDYLGFIHNPTKIKGHSVKLNGAGMYMVHRHDIYKHERNYNKLAMFHKHPYVFLAVDFYTSVKLGEIKGIKGVSRFLRTRDYLKRNRQTRAITKEIHKEGLTKYLMLDDPKVVRKLNRKYRNKRQGIDLLIRLIYKKYNRNYP